MVASSEGGMKADEFIKAIMHVSGLPSRVDADNAVRSTLETISEHLAGGEPENLASQLPHEIAIFLNQPFLGHAERFDLQELFQRVAASEGVSYDNCLAISLISSTCKTQRTHKPSSRICNPICSPVQISPTSARRDEFVTTPCSSIHKNPG
jgi:uncharacterized protein (DUF2267 family)